MRDNALKEAIDAAGGVGALAKEIAVSRQAISQWERVPGNRVLAVEKATGVSRYRLRPDLYGDAQAAPRPINAAALELLRRWRRERVDKEQDPNLDADFAELRANRIGLRTFD